MAYSDFTRQEYSQADFLRLLEHRVRKDIRINDLINPKETYVLPDKDSALSALLKHFLDKIFHERLQFGEKGISLSCEILESYVSSRLDVFLKGDGFSVFTTDVISPLRTLTQHEAKQAIEFLNLEGEFEEVSQSVVDGLQKKYPQTKASFLKSFLHIEEELDKA